MTIAPTGSVLVVEPAVEQAARDLDRSGFLVRRAEWQNALSMAVSGAFDVALLDVTMPAVGGLSLVARLREQAPNMRVVVLVAKHTNELAARSAEVGVFQMLQKPADSGSLLRVIRAAILDRQRIVSSSTQQQTTPPVVTSELDKMVSRMQTSSGRAAARGLFDVTPEALGEAALAGAATERD